MYFSLRRDSQLFSLLLVLTPPPYCIWCSTKYTPLKFWPGVEVVEGMVGEVGRRTGVDVDDVHTDNDQKSCDLLCVQEAFTHFM